MPRGEPVLGSADSGNPFLGTVSTISLHPHKTTQGGIPKPRILGFRASSTKLPRVKPFFLGSLR
eukprot:11735010-Alexandrium_andersonii.AAC.1